MTGAVAKAIGKFLEGLDALSGEHGVFIQRGEGGFVLTWGNPGETLAQFQPVDRASSEYSCNMTR